VSFHPAGIARDALDRWVLLRSAEAAAEALPATRREKAAALHAAGDARRDAALGHRGVAALVLARAAVALYVEASVTALSDELPTGGASLDALWGRYDAIASNGLLAPVPARLESARRESVTTVTPDAEIAEHGEAPADATLALAAFLADGLDVRSPARIRVERRVRQVTLAMAAVLLVAEVIAHRPRGPNMALHAAVVASSRRPGSGAPLDLTNGKVEDTAAFSTKDEADPWLTVDFVIPRRVHEITLVNSPDHEDDSLPLRAETSVDGTKWEAAAIQTRHFTASDPAILSFSSRPARFVRIHGRSGGAIYLTEIEVR
jgi:hypothetical protein